VGNAEAFRFSICPARAGVNASAKICQAGRNKKGPGEIIAGAF
jgi:hypothetical protein